MAKQDKKEPLNDNEETKVKTLDNNKEPATEPVMPKNFTITAEGVNEWRKSHDKLHDILQIPIHGIGPV